MSNVPSLIYCSILDPINFYPMLLGSVGRNHLFTGAWDCRLKPGSRGARAATECGAFLPALRFRPVWTTKAFSKHFPFIGPSTRNSIIQNEGHSMFHDMFSRYADAKLETLESLTVPVPVLSRRINNRQTACLRPPPDEFHGIFHGTFVI